MMILLVILLAVPCFAGPKYSYSDPKLDDEMDSIYREIAKERGPQIFTKAQLLALTPRRAGLIYFCTDCSTDGIVVSTAATLGGVGRISARTTAIN